MLLERIHVDLFDGDLQRVIAILPRAALRLPDPLPVGRLIHRAAKAITFHKRLDQYDRVSVLALPVRRKPPQHAPQDITPQVRNAHPGQNEKFMIVGDAGQVRAPFFLAPANILIALPALPGRRTKQQARQQPPPVLANRILQVLSYRAAGAKIVKLGQRGGQLLPLGRHTADFLDGNRAQFCEGTVVGCLIPQPRREHARAHTVGRYLTPRWKSNQASLVQFQQQGPRGHVLPQPSPITPIPLLTQRLGQSPPAPVWMSRQQLADLLQVALCYLSALHQQSVVHQGSMPEDKSGVQQKRKRKSKRNRGELVYARYHWRRGVPSKPWISRFSSSGRKQRLGPSPVGHPKVPLSKRLVHTHSPEPSQTNSRSRVRLRFVNTKKWPESGSCCNTLCTRAYSPLKFCRISTGSRATKMRVAVDGLSMTGAPSSATTRSMTAWRPHRAAPPPRRVT